MIRKAFSLDINGDKWDVVFGNPGNKNNALCDYSKKRIVLRKKRSPEDLEKDISHECLHAAIPDIDEDAVERAEDALCRGIAALRTFLIENPKFIT